MTLPPIDTDDRRRVVANLDAEASWAGLRQPGYPYPSLSRAAKQRMAAAGSLLRVFCRPGDCLWLPADLAEQRLPPFPDMPVPVLETGPVDDLPPLPSRLWASAPPWCRDESAVKAAAEANDRTTAIESAVAMGASLEHSRLIRSMDELRQHLERTKLQSWVLKALLSAAGRNRFISRPEIKSGPSPEKLFHRHGTLLFEPWLPRIEDFGALFSIGDHGLEDDPRIHRQQIGPTGAFLGISLGGSLGLSSDDFQIVHRVVERVAERLATAGYRGPVGMDFWRYRDAEGRVRLNPLGEINARSTFGHVARAWAEALFPQVAQTDETRVEIQLSFGSGPVPSPGPTEAVVPLLHPGNSRGESQSSWIKKAPAGEKRACSDQQEEPPPDRIY